jgi:hypothetical protein
MQSHEVAFTIVDLIEPRLPVNYRGSSLAHQVGIPWEYVIEGVFSEQEQRIYELTQDALEIAMLQAMGRVPHGPDGRGGP